MTVTYFEGRALNRRSDALRSLHRQSLEISRDDRVTAVNRSPSLMGHRSHKDPTVGITVCRTSRPTGLSVLHDLFSAQLTQEEQH